MTLNCWIIDDEPLALDLLESYISKTPFLKLTGRFSSALQALQSINSEDTVHLIFLDIQMPELSGMEFAKLVDKQTRIILTTAFSEYAIDSYKINALDYLLKPFSYADFLTAAKKAVDWFEITASAEHKSDKIQTGFFVRSEYQLVQILFDELLYIEGLKDYVKIYCEDKPRPILTLMSMKAVEEMIPAKQFLRVHRSYIVNRNKITKIDKNRIIIGKQEIPIGNTYRKTFIEIIEGK